MILYISTNDGSDMRINKEIITLSRKFPVIFLGIGEPTQNFLKEYCSDSFLIKGSKSSLSTWLRFILFAWKLVFTRKITSIHLINEELLFLFYPLCYIKYTVLDVFDSIFLRKNFPPFIKKILMYFTYLPVNIVIVTDNVRKELMPEFIKRKLTVVENFPMKMRDAFSRDFKKGNGLNIVFYGWLGMYRGGSFVQSLLNSGMPVHIYMAGWFSDEECKKLTENPNVTYWGVLPQNEAIRRAAAHGDYILCMYAPINKNNIYASPNKIYDAVQIGVPVIINQEVKVSEMVKENGFGFVLDRYYPDNIQKIYLDLEDHKHSFSFPEDLAQKFIWENIEERLIKAHTV